MHRNHHLKPNIDLTSLVHLSAYRNGIIFKSASSFLLSKNGSIGIAFSLLYVHVTCESSIITACGKFYALQKNLN